MHLALGTDVVETEVVAAVRMAVGTVEEAGRTGIAGAEDFVRRE